MRKILSTDRRFCKSGDSGGDGNIDIEGEEEQKGRNAVTVLSHSGVMDCCKFCGVDTWSLLSVSIG